MVKHKLSVSVHEELRAGIPAPILRHRPVPRPGDRLRRAVDSALSELTREEPAGRRADDLLVGGLAWAAATGDTCRIEPAVHQVRTALVRLRSADPDGARTALLAAREGLGRPLPSQREAR